MSAKRILVTGGAGFIGSHIVAGLLGRGTAVTVLDDFSTGSRENLRQVQADPQGRADLRIVDGSVTDPGAVAAGCEGAEVVIHLAALPSVTRSVEAPLVSHDRNVTGALVVLDEARRRGLKTVYAGSSSAYGDQDVEFKTESLRESPLSPYAATKLAGELYCRAFSRVYGVPTVVTRFFNVFGPRQVPDSPYSGVVAAFCYALLKGKKPFIEGDGLQSRDFTYVEDVVRGVLLAMDTQTSGCHTVNIACGKSHSVKELLETLQRIAGTGVAPEMRPPRAGDVRHSKADIGAAKALLGYAPRVSFAEGLERTFAWYRSTHR